MGGLEGKMLIRGVWALLYVYLCMFGGVETERDGEGWRDPVNRPSKSSSIVSRTVRRIYTCMACVVPTCKAS